MTWSFAMVNGKLSEIFWDLKRDRKKQKVDAHCYVKRSEYKTKREQAMIDKDLEYYRFSWRHGIYTRLSSERYSTRNTPK